MPRLKSILAEHKKYRPRHTLPGNLGDGYLLEHNPVYRAVREESIGAGFRFSPKRFHDYDVLPLTQLPRILKSRTIPYRDNVRPLVEVERRAPGALDWDQIPKLRPNHVFHESAHALARTITRRHLGRPRGERELALQLLLEESFANAVESLANVYAESPLHNEFLYKNSYIMEKPAIREKIRKALAAHPVETALKTLILSFLHANFVQTHDASRAWSRIKPLLPAKGLAVLRPVFRIGFDLDPRFTLFTNAFCLRLEGIKTELLDLLDFDFVEYFVKRDAHSRALDQLSLAIIAWTE
jgi:hypothetical protein